MSDNLDSSGGSLDRQLIEIISELKKTYPGIISNIFVPKKIRTRYLTSEDFDFDSFGIAKKLIRGIDLAIGDSSLQQTIGEAYPSERYFSYNRLYQLANEKYLLLQDFYIGSDTIKIKDNDRKRDIQGTEIKALAELFAERIGALANHQNLVGIQPFSWITAIPFVGSSQQIKKFAVSRISEYIELCKYYPMLTWTGT